MSALRATRPPRPPPPTRWVWAGLLALCAHLPLLSLRCEAPPSEAPRPLSLELAERPPPPDLAAPPAPPPRASPARREASSTSAFSQAPPPPAQASAAHSAPTPPPVAASPSDAPAAPPAVAAPSALAALAASEAASADAPDLFPTELLARHAGVQLPVGMHDGRRIEAALQAELRALKAADRVRAGLVDPYFFELGDAMDEAFTPSWGALDKEAGTDSIWGTLKAFGLSWSAEAERYVLTGSPYHPGERDSLVGGAGGPPSAGLEAPGAAHTQQRLLDEASTLWRDLVQGRAGGFELRALLEVVQAPAGELIRVRLIESSGKPRYDQLALDSVRRSLRGLPPPARAGAGLGLEGETIVSRWAFLTRYSVVPPGMLGLGVDGGAAALGVGGCDLDAEGQCYWPLKKLVRSRIELVEVY